MAKMIASSTTGKVYLLLLFIFMMHLVASSRAAYSVVSFGAKGDAKTDSTQAFLKAWSSACNSRTAATLYVPRGTFVVRSVVFGGPCKSRIMFRIDGTIVAPSNYWNLGNSGYWIMFNKVSRLSISGGTVDARGAAFWACRRAGNKCPNAARSITFSWSNNVVVSGLTSLNSQSIHMAINHCNNLLIRNVKIRAPSGSPNTDGILMQSSSGITISNTAILTGDDCISMGQGTKNVWIERISCGPGHGISIGSLGDSVSEEGVQNITVTSSVFTKTQNGVRIKSWGRPSNGYATNIAFRNLIMNKVDNPIIIDQNYCPYNKGCPRQSSGVEISGVTYSNIKGTSATRVAMSFDCSSSNPCRGIRLQDIKLTFLKKPAVAYCKNAQGSATGVVVPKSCL